MANNVDPDQMLHSVAFHLGLLCLQGLSVPILRVITVKYFRSSMVGIPWLHSVIKDNRFDTHLHI